MKTIRLSCWSAERARRRCKIDYHFSFSINHLARCSISHSPCRLVFQKEKPVVFQYPSEERKKLAEVGSEKTGGGNQRRHVFDECKSFHREADTQPTEGTTAARHA